MADEPTLNGFDQAAKDAVEAADAYDAQAKFGGKLSHEEIEKEEQAAASRPADQGPTEGPTPAEPATEAPPVADPWALLAEGAGKWKDAEEAKKGYFHGLNLAKNAMQERDQLRAELDALKGQVTPNGGQTTPAEDWLKKVEDYGIDSSVLANAIDQRAEQRLMEILAPMAATYQSEQHLSEKYGDAWAKNKAEVNMFIESDPALRAQYHAVRAMGTPEAIRTADEFAFLSYKEARGSVVEESLKANHAARQQINQEALKDASIVGAKRSEGRDADTKPKDEMTEERFENLKARARAGYAAPLWRETIGKGLPSELFG